MDQARNSSTRRALYRSAPTFFELLQLLYDHAIALPSYHQSSDLISQHYNTHETTLIAVLKK